MSAESEKRECLKVKCSNTIFFRDTKKYVVFIKSNLLVSSRKKPCLAVTFFTDRKGCLRIDNETNTGFSFVFSKRK